MVRLGIDLNSFLIKTCKMGLTVQGRSDNFVKLAKDGDGVDFQGMEMREVYFLEKIFVNISLSWPPLQGEDDLLNMKSYLKNCISNQSITSVWPK